MALTQAYAEIRPFRLNAWRSRLKLGAFKAPISPENRLPGWHSAYCLSPSAINTRIGEEFRTTGAEYDLDWLGRQHGHDRELGLRAAAYDWNDYSGQLRAQRGKYLDALELRALHYGNHVNPDAYSYKFNMFGWHTWFGSAGLRWTPSDRWTVISQWLAGTALTGDSDPALSPATCLAEGAVRSRNHARFRRCPDLHTHFPASSQR
ncbi:MAG: hypothetical protein WA446_11540 [Steroidobacteraceae bacterium]